MIDIPLEDKHLTPEQRREHYEVEKELANRLRNATKQERSQLYSTLYEELYDKIPYHSKLTQKSSSMRGVELPFLPMQMGFLRRFLHKDTIFLEIGSGDCSLSLEVAKSVHGVYAVDVSEKITQNLTLPSNFQLVLSNGCSIPLPTDSIDVAYSNQLMEHLHPDDAMEQLQDIHRVLVPGGLYICVTPHRLSGPHDISRYFDEVATGFHLKEYTISELRDLFKKAGFSKVEVYAGGRGKYLSSPVLPVMLCERLLSTLPRRFRKTIVSNLPLRVLFGIRIVGTK